VVRATGSGAASTDSSRSRPRNLVLSAGSVLDYKK